MGKSDYKISIQSEYVLVERPRDYEVVLNEQPAMLMELSSVCEEAACRKVLILGPKTKVNLATLDILDLGRAIAKQDLRIAMVEAHDASDEDVNFLGDVVWNRGGSIRFFDSEMEARYWLRIS